MNHGVPLLIGIAAIAIVVSLGCRQTPERQAGDTAEKASQVAVSPEQQRLWKQAAEKGNTPGLDRVPIAQRPVDDRQRPPSPSASPAQRPPTTIAPRAETEIRILVHPNADFTGAATVSGVPGDQIQLTLANGGTLTVLARVAGAQLRVASGETVQVAYQFPPMPHGPQDAGSVIAIRTAAGLGIAHVIRGGTNPVTMAVPLFGVTASQNPKEPQLLEVRAGPSAAAPPMRMGATRQVGDVIVQIVEVNAPEQGVKPGQLDGPPYALNVMVWKAP